MAFADRWRELRETCRARKDDVTLLTPSSRRRFAVEDVGEDRIVVWFPDEDDERALLRDQFEVLADRIESAPVGLTLDDLPPGVEPYATLLSLSDRYAVDEDGSLLHVAEDAEGVGEGEGEREEGENPLVREGRPEPTAPERLHDDLLLLADSLDRLDVRDPRSLTTERLTDLYVLLSEVQWDANELRRGVSDVLTDRIGPEGRLHGRFGTVSRTVRERRHPKPDEEVLAALDAEDIPREWVLGVDADKLDVVLAVTDLDESAVYDVSEQVYVQKTGVDEGAKRSRLQGIKDRLAALDSEEADDLMDDVETIEARLDDLLAAG